MSNYLGIDLGGTNIKFGVVDESGVISRGEIPTEVEMGADSITLKLEKIINDAKDEFDIKAVGIGVPGLVDKSQKVVIDCKNLFWKNLPLGITLEENTGVKVFMGNDANMATIAEHSFGNLKDVDNGILLTLGTGVGGGVVIDGNIYRGSNGLGFEVGHMKINGEGYPCNCGRKDCFETYSSATALIRYFNSEYNEKITEAKEVFDLFKSGDRKGIEAIQWYLEHLADGIVNLINLFDPEIIILAGGVSKAFNSFEELLDKKIKEKIFTDQIDIAKILRSKLDNDSGILGSAMLAKGEN